MFPICRNINNYKGASELSNQRCSKQGIWFHISLINSMVDTTCIYNQ